MYRIFRNTHLMLGLSTLLFLLMYAVSAVQMAHRVRLTPTIRDEDLGLPAALEARALARQLMDQKGYEGDLGNVQNTPEGYRFNVARPGANYQVAYNKSTGQTHVREAKANWLGILNRLHHLHGFNHEDPATNLWAWALAFVSVALLVMGSTGIYMWYKLRRDRFIGTVLLATNLAISLAILISLRAGS